MKMDMINVLECELAIVLQTKTMDRLSGLDGREQDATHLNHIVIFCFSSNRDCLDDWANIT